MIASWLSTVRVIRMRKSATAAIRISSVRAMPKIFKTDVEHAWGPPPRGKKPVAEPSGRHDTPRLLDGRSHGAREVCLPSRARATENRVVQADRGLAPNHLFMSVSATESRTTVGS